LRSTLRTRGGTVQLDVDEKALVLVSTLFRRKAGTVDHAFAGVCLGCGNVIGAPAFGVLNYSKCISALGVAVVGTFAVGLPVPVD